jgi:hypothetical protein
MSEILCLPDANVRSQSFFVARARARCCHCSLSTHVLALAMPDEHETLEPEIEGDADDRGEPKSADWQRADASAFLFYVEQLPGEIQGRLNGLSPFYRLAYSAATLGCYWANHCEHCGTLLGDHELHCEPDGAFMPSSEAAAAEIELLAVPAPFEAAAAGIALEPEFFRFMSRG